MIPTVPGPPPKLQTNPSELEVFRARAFSLLSIVGVSGFCQVNCPYVLCLCVFVQHLRFLSSLINVVFSDTAGKHTTRDV